MRRTGRMSSARALAMAVLLLLAAVLAGCGNGDGNARAAALARRMPSGGAKFIMFDLEILRTDSDLEDLYQGFTEGLDEMCETVGLSADDVDAVAIGDQGAVFDGRFDLDDVRDTLADEGFQEDEYQGIQTWEKDGTAVALVSSRWVIMGPVDDFDDAIDVINGEAESLWDDADMKDIVVRLPAGLMTVYGLGGGVTVQEEYRERYRDLDSLGASMGKRDKDALWIFYAFRFEDEDAADEAIEGFEEFARQSLEEDGVDYTHLEASQDGRFIEMSVDIDMDDFRFY